ncbi:MAG: (d)CMP kinase [Candidatus Sericytochromatia bacterium]
MSTESSSSTPQPERPAARLRRLTVAIDGPAGAGKSTVAQKVAKQLTYVYIDTGAMYRGVTWKALHMGVEWGNPEAIAEIARHTTIALVPPPDLTGKQHVLVDGQDVTAEIRLPEVSQRVSEVASIPEVRAVLTAQQQAMGVAGGVVMDGRDIGTAVFPHAEVKIFLTASTRERTRRRWLELAAQGITVDFDQLERDILARDLADSQRAVAPLKAAPDAILVDTDGKGPEEVIAWILNIFEERRQALLVQR